MLVCLEVETIRLDLISHADCIVLRAVTVDGQPFEKTFDREDLLMGAYTAAKVAKK